MTMHRSAVTARICSMSAIAAACALALAATDTSAARTTDGTAAATCRTSELVVWIDTRGDAAAGSIFYNLDFTNQSGHTCALTGYPGVSALDLRGHRLGGAATRSPSVTHLVSLPNGATATAQLRIAQAADFPSSTCHPAAAAGLRIYPPNQTAAKLVPIPFKACSRTGPIFLSVKAVSGTGR
jgi:hypothetical protein